MNPTEQERQEWIEDIKFLLMVATETDAYYEIRPDRLYSQMDRLQAYLSTSAAPPLPEWVKLPLGLSDNCCVYDDTMQKVASFGHYRLAEIFRDHINAVYGKEKACQK